MEVKGTKVSGECCVFVPVDLLLLHIAVTYDGKSQNRSRDMEAWICKPFNSLVSYHNLDAAFFGNEEQNPIKRFICLFIYFCNHVNSLNSTALKQLSLFLEK